MKILKNTLKVISGVLLILFAAIVAVVGLIWMKPSIVINDTTLTYATGWLKENTAIDISYDEIHAVSASPSFWKKSFALEGQKICLNNPDFMARGCIDKVALGAVVDLSGFGLKINSIDQAILQTKNFVVDLRTKGEPQEFQAEQQPSEPLDPEALREMINSFLKTTQIGIVDINAEDLRVYLDALGLEIDLEAEKIKPEGGQKSILKVTANEKTIEGDLKQSADVALTLTPTGPNFTGLWAIEMDLNFSMPQTVAVVAALKLNEENDGFFGFSIGAQTTLFTPTTPGPDNFIQVDTNGRTDLNQIDGQLQVIAKNFLPENSDVLMKGCQYKGAVPYLTKEGRFNLGCQVVLPVKVADHWVSEVKKTGKITLPPEVVIQVDAAIDTQLLAVTGQMGEASLRAELAPWREGYLGVEALVDVSAKGKDIMDFAALEIVPKMNAKIEVESFQKLVQALTNTPFAIPAPLNVLTGKITFSSNGQATGNMEEFKIPLNLKTRLSSKMQKLDTSTTGLITYKPKANGTKMFLDIDAILEDIQIQLPDINPIAGMPALTPDARIKSLKGVPLKDVIPEESTEDSGPGFLAYNVDIKTKNPNSIQLKSNLLKGTAPIAVAINMSSAKGMTGYVNVHDATVEYLRRTARIQKIRIDFPNQPGAPQEIDGLIQTTQQDVDVFIELKGSVSSPQILMWSRPDLPQQSIISLLLFNRPVSELNSEESESSSAASQALTDGAIGIIGMWAFASTPIQSVSYNPETQVYSASVDLGGGTSLSVGSNWEKTQTAQLRKRLSQNWLLTTSVEPSTGDNSENVGEAVLQWQKRY